MLNTELGLKDIVENPKSIFYVLSQEEKEELQHHITLTHYKKNEFVFKEGDKPVGFLLLIDGKVKIKIDKSAVLKDPTDIAAQQK